VAIAVLVHAPVLAPLASAKRVTREPERDGTPPPVEVPIEAFEPAPAAESATSASAPTPATTPTPTSAPTPTPTSASTLPPPPTALFGSDPLDAIHAQIASWDPRLLKGEHKIAANARLASVADYPDRRTPRTLIDRVVATHSGQFRACHSAGLPRSALIAGFVRVAFVIDADGKVTQTRDAGGGLEDEAVRQCVVQAFGRLAFAPTRLRSPQSLTYDVQLESEGEP
jgi:hypothetical protein